MSPFRPVEKKVMDHDSQAPSLQLPCLNLAMMSSCPLPSKLQLSKGLYQKADWSIGSWLSAVWQELKVQKSPTGIEKFVTECVRKSLSEAIKAHERASALMVGSGPAAWLIPICLLLCLPFHGQRADYIAEQLLWERWRLKRGRTSGRRILLNVS